MKSGVSTVNGNLWGRGGDKACVAYSIIAKAIACPLAGGGEIEFVVFPAVDRSNESFAAGMLPEAVSSDGWARNGQFEVGGVAAKVVAQHQVTVVDQTCADFDRADGGARGARVTKQ